MAQAILENFQEFLFMLLMASGWMGLAWVSLAGRRKAKAGSSEHIATEQLCAAHFRNLSDHSKSILKEGLKTYLYRGKGPTSSAELAHVLDCWVEGCKWGELSVKIVQDFIENFGEYQFSQENYATMVASKMLADRGMVFLYFSKEGLYSEDTMVHTRRGRPFTLPSEKHFLVIIAETSYAEPSYVKTLYSPFHCIPQVLHGRALASVLKTSDPGDKDSTEESSEESVENIL